MDAWQVALQKARRKAPPTFDFEALERTYAARTTGLLEAWRTAHPSLDVCILEIVVEASGSAKHRLRRYGEFSGFNSATPGFLIQRSATTLARVHLATLIVGVAAARASVASVRWMLLTTDEALASPP